MNRWIAAVTALPLLAACGGATSSSDTDEGAATARVTFRLPLVDDNGTPLTIYNDALAKKGIAPFPAYIVVDEKNGEALHTFWRTRVEDAAAAIGKDFYLAGGSPDAFGKGLCYEGDGTKVGRLSESMTDGFFSDQFILGGWRYKDKMYDAYPDEDPSAKGSAWTNWKGTGEDVLLAFSTDDDGTMGSSVVPRCSGAPASDPASVVFVTQEAASPLTLSIYVRDGVKKTTLNKRFLKVVAARAGKTFEAFCDLQGDNDAASKRLVTRIECALVAETVSHDDDESLLFSIIEEKVAGKAPAYSLEEVQYSGDGTFLGDQLDVLMGENMEGTEFDLDRKTNSSEASNPFTVGAAAHKALGTLAGEDFYVKNLGATTTVHDYSAFRIDATQAVTFDVRLGPTGGERAYGAGTFSLLSTEGVLADGYATASTLASRAKKSLPKQP